jgi:competence protein ComEC
MILWLPVMLGAGDHRLVRAARCGDVERLPARLRRAGGAGAGDAGRGAGRRDVVTIGGIAMALGCGLIWWRAESVAAPVLARPAMVAFEAKVERVEQLPARELVRLTLAPVADAGLPPRVRSIWPGEGRPEGVGAARRSGCARG